MPRASRMRWSGRPTARYATLAFALTFSDFLRHERREILRLVLALGRLRKRVRGAGRAIEPKCLRPIARRARRGEPQRGVCALRGVTQHAAQPPTEIRHRGLHAVRVRPAGMHYVASQAVRAVAALPVLHQLRLTALVHGVGIHAVVLPGILHIHVVQRQRRVVHAAGGHFDDGRLRRERRALQQGFGQDPMREQIRGVRGFKPFRGRRQVIQQQPDVVDEHIDACAARENCSRGAPCVRDEREIGEDRDYAARARRLAHQGVEFLVTASQCEHGRTATRRAFDDRAADAAGRACHDPGPAGKVGA